MKKLLVPLVLFLLLLPCGCALTIKPNPVDNDAVVNPADHSITLTRNNIQLTARVQDVAVGGYAFQRAIASFYLDAKNRSANVSALPLAAMELHDSRGGVHQPLDPEQVARWLNPAPDYLVPFPYVGYLDITAQESYRASSSMASEQPYVGQGLPRDTSRLPDAFSAETLAPGAQVSGVVYFELDLHQMSSVELILKPVGTSATYRFPFLIEK